METVMHRRLPPSSMSMAVLGLSLLSALVIISLSGCGQPASPTVASATARPVLVAQAERLPLGGLDFVGEVRALHRAELTFNVPGVVREVLVEPGDRVRAGQVLARLDTLPTQAQLSAAQAEVSRGQSALAEALRRQARLQAARDQGAASESEWTAVQAEVQAATAALSAARAQQDNAAWSRQQTELRAPFAGHVGGRQLEVGQAAGAGTPVLVVDGAGRELLVTVPASLGVRAGQVVQLSTPAGQVDSRVLAAPQRLAAGQSYRVQLSAPDSWQVGDAVPVRLAAAGDRQATLQIPLRAVQAAAAGKPATVLKLSGDGQTVQRVPVTLGEPAGSRIEVRSGLAAGDRVVVAGAHALETGARVTAVTQLR